MIHALAWLRSIGWPFRFSHHENKRIDGRLERAQAIHAAPQMAGSYQFLPYSGAACCDQAIGDYFKNSDATINETSGNGVEVNKWGGAVAGDLEAISDLSRGYGIGNLSGLYVSAHKHILLTIGDNGKAYDLSGRKWSRSGRLPAILAWLLILSMAAIVIATLLSGVWS